MIRAFIMFIITLLWVAPQSFGAVNYDTRGNITRLGGQYFVYDHSNQPIQLSGDVSGSYLYDGNMKRVRVTMDGETHYNVYDRSGKLVHVDNRAGADTRTNYVFAGSQMIARMQKIGSAAAVPSYQHTDLLGSPVTGTDSSGAITWRERYTPFGEKLLKPTQLDNHASFTGHIDDSATGLTYMQARYYDPNIGRFLSIDPVEFMDTGNAGMFNRYAYTFNDPINHTDPDGEFAHVVFGGAVGGLVGGIHGFATTGGSISDRFKGAGAGAAGGAVSGAIIAGTGQVTVGLAAGSATSSVVSQLTTGDGQVSLAETAVDTAVGATVGKVVGKVKVPGITSGRNSHAAVTKSNTTKLSNGTIGSVSAQSVAKGVSAGVVGGSGQAVVRSASGSAIDAGVAAGQQIGNAAGQAAGAINSARDAINNIPRIPEREPF